MASKTLFPDHLVQTFLQKNGTYTGKIDGDFGQKSMAAMDTTLNGTGINIKGWNFTRKRLALEQFMLQSWGFNPGAIDGLWGVQTQDALERWQNKARDTEGKASSSIIPTGADKAVPVAKPIIKNDWPLQKDVRKHYGEPGKNLTMLDTPYPLRIAWNTSQTVNRFAIHEKCHDSAKRVMGRILDAYKGVDNLKRLGLDLFGGCYMNRLKKGGNTLSMHAWAIAIDWDPEHNQFRWGANRARLDDPEYDRFMDLWEEEGWLSLGRARNYDWMHVQAARL